MDLVSNIQRIAFKLFFVILACSVLFWFSLFTYGLLYYLYIPAIAHVKPVHLIYDTLCPKGQIHCKNPYANVSLTGKSNYELTRGQAYAIELVLDMPESERNLNQGMFMVKVDMLSENGEILQTSRRPAILRYRSALFKVAYTLFYMPALLLGSTEEKQTLHIPLFEQFSESNPIYYVFVEIEAEVAEIYSSTLKIHAQFTGLRYMMYYWPVSSLIIGVGSNFFFIISIAIAFWIRQEINSANNLEHSFYQERDSSRGIRRAIQLMPPETQRLPTSSFERRTDISTEKRTDSGRSKADLSPLGDDVEIISPHESEESASLEAQKLTEELSPSGGTVGIRRRLATPPEQ